MKEIDRDNLEMKKSRLASEPVNMSEWSARSRASEFAFDGDMNSLLDSVAELDRRVSDQIVSDAKHRMGHQNGEAPATDRLAVPDSAGDLWTFRVSPMKSYPSLSKGPVVFYCLEPHYYDWLALRPADAAADAEWRGWCRRCISCRRNFIVGRRCRRSRGRCI